VLSTVCVLKRDVLTPPPRSANGSANSKDRAESIMCHNSVTGNKDCDTVEDNDPSN